MCRMNGTKRFAKSRPGLFQRWPAARAPREAPTAPAAPHDSMSPRGSPSTQAGNLFVADSGNHTIRRIASDGSVTTVAGTVGVAGYQDGAVSAAQFHNPNGVAVDSSGNILVADSGNNVIRRIAPDGTVATVAGRPGPYGAGYADGNGNQAGFNFPAAICLDSTANAYVADYFNNAVRKVTPAAAVSTLAGSPYRMGAPTAGPQRGIFGAVRGGARLARSAICCGHWEQHDSFDHTRRHSDYRSRHRRKHWQQRRCGRRCAVQSSHGRRS